MILARTCWWMCFSLYSFIVGGRNVAFKDFFFSVVHDLLYFNSFVVSFYHLWIYLSLFYLFLFCLNLWLIFLSSNVNVTEGGVRSHRLADLKSIYFTGHTFQMIIFSCFVLFCFLKQHQLLIYVYYKFCWSSHDCFSVVRAFCQLQSAFRRTGLSIEGLFLISPFEC